MAQAGAVINIVGPHHHTGEFLERVRVLVRRLSGCNAGEGAPILDQLVRDKIQRLIPTCRLQYPVFVPDKRSSKSVGVMDEAGAKTTLNTEHTLAG